MTFLFDIFDAILTVFGWIRSSKDRTIGEQKIENKDYAVENTELRKELVDAENKPTNDTVLVSLRKHEF